MRRKFSLIEDPDYKINGDTIEEKLQKASRGCSFHIAVNLWRDLRRDLGHHRAGLGSGQGSFRDDRARFRNASLRSDDFRRGLDDRGSLGALRIDAGSWSRIAKECKRKPETRLRVPSPSKGILGDLGRKGYLRGPQPCSRLLSTQAPRLGPGSLAAEPCSQRTACRPPPP
ncbi:hypothetical protein AAC387_Pa06g0086 [Persea americana]